MQTLLAIRRGAEEAAARLLEAANLRRGAAEARQAALDTEVRAAREELRSRRTQAGGGPGAATAGLGAARERFWQRLREGVAALAATAHAHRDGPLAVARAAAVEAAATHRAARAARELMEKVCQKADETRRRIEVRRAEVGADEQAQVVAAANRAVNSAGPPSSRGSNPR